jgi:hypothetical protein
MKNKELENLIKIFFKEHIISISEEPINRKITTIDLIKKSTDKIIYNLTDEAWYKFDNVRLKDKQINNKIGELHEFLLAKSKNYVKCNSVDKNIQVDIMKTDKSVFIELKNKYNTMNNSSKLQTIERLKDIKHKYPESLCLIGIINGKNNSSSKKKISSNPEIWKYTGEELFNLVFNEKNYLNTVESIITSGLKLWIEEYKKENSIENNKEEINDNIQKIVENYEYIIVKDNEYIKIDSNVYTIKNNKPNKLCGIITVQGKFRPLKQQS